MQILSLELQDYRNYPILEMTFGPGRNLLFGDNAQGKTNLLEAIYLGSTTKSHRGSKDREMIRFGAEEAHIRLSLEKEGVPHRIDFHLKKNSPKGVAIDGSPIRRSSELMGFLKVVFFSPEDLSIIKNGPGERRRFMDMELCQLERSYLSALSGYNKAVNQRNMLLRQWGKREFNETLLSVLDEQMVAFGIPLMEQREAFLQEMNLEMEPIGERITAGKEKILLHYVPNTTKEHFLSALQESRERDLRFKMTHTGPHRDDLSVTINGMDARKYGSQGQQRTAALGMKLAEISLVKERTGTMPVLLLDDVLSELDRNRQTDLWRAIGEAQTILTCTGLEEFVSTLSREQYIYHVEKGTVTRMNVSGEVPTPIGGSDE